MIIYVSVKPHAKIEKFEKISENGYRISLREKAISGAANKALIKLLAKKFGVSAGKIDIKTPRSRKKIIEILGA